MSVIYHIVNGHELQYSSMMASFDLTGVPYVHLNLH